MRLEEEPAGVPGRGYQDAIREISARFGPETSREEGTTKVVEELRRLASCSVTLIPLERVIPVRNGVG